MAAAPAGCGISIGAIGATGGWFDNAPGTPPTLVPPSCSLVLTC
ncbi:hypothetical protein YPPY46_2131 [Yersinia pestis PY-46]|nr:hypothetical protein YPPY32_2420 [Yersinia pestis PY-32]EIS05548.1 hypothetical protein YPPY46_2131 [Yersinia pestis PY-46]EIS18936.1 hypothetical protein YPPY52_2189 [Yersinia pestis PY-52]EIS19557.1 hypothetical protein YPPY53_2201 [Yersinia pestis PY-53]EIS43756.1 hypothetical protein YPPY58_2184 [Yersinia pestis PY-58]